MQHSRNARSVKQHYGTGMMQNCIKFRCKKAMPVHPHLSRFQAVFTRNYFHNPVKIQFYFIQFCIEKTRRRASQKSADIWQRRCVLFASTAGQKPGPTSELINFELSYISGCSFRRKLRFTAAASAALPLRGSDTAISARSAQSADCCLCGSRCPQGLPEPLTEPS